MKLIKESFDRLVDRERRIADYRAKHLSEDVKKLADGKWANVGKDGKVDSGKFKTKKEADAQRKAMFANGYKGESLKEALSSYPVSSLREVQRAISRDAYEYGYSDFKADDILEEIIQEVISKTYGEGAQIEASVQAGRGRVDVYTDDGIYTWDYEDEAYAMTRALKEASSWDDVYEAFSDFVAENARLVEYDDDDDEDNDDDSLEESFTNKDADQIKDEAVEEVEVTVDGEPMIPESEASVEDEHSAENVPEMPDTNCKMIIANILNPLIKDELEAIDGYNSAVSSIRGIVEDPEHDTSIDYDGIMAVLAEITNEENLHIGQLEKLLETVSPNAESINDGKEEAEEQLAEVGEPEQKSDSSEEA